MEYVHQVYMGVHLTKAQRGSMGSGQGLSPQAQVPTSTQGTEASTDADFMYEEHLPFRHPATVLAPFPISFRHPASPRHSSH